MRADAPLHELANAASTDDWTVLGRGNADPFDLSLAEWRVGSDHIDHLRDVINERGTLAAVVVDEFGTVYNGNHRVTIAREEGLPSMYVRVKVGLMPPLRGERAYPAFVALAGAPHYEAVQESRWGEVSAWQERVRRARDAAGGAAAD